MRHFLDTVYSTPADCRKSYLHEFGKNPNDHQVRHNSLRKMFTAAHQLAILLRTREAWLLNSLVTAMVIMSSKTNCDKVSTCKKP